MLGIPLAAMMALAPAFLLLAPTAIAVTGTKVTASIPHSATTGAKLKVTGTVAQVVRFCEPGPCGDYDEPYAGRVLTARWSWPASASRWRAAGEFRSAVTL